MKTNRSTIKRPCSQPQGFSDPQKSYIRETSYFHIFHFPRVFHPPSEHPQQPYPFLDPRKIQHTGNPIFSKNFNFRFHRDSLYTISLYKLLYYFHSGVGWKIYTDLSRQGGWNTTSDLSRQGGWNTTSDLSRETIHSHIQ